MARALAAWVARLPATGAPKLSVRSANPGEPERQATLVLDKAFWNNRKYVWPPALPGPQR